ncbi:protein NRT1/ PTR FAMILY 5.11-like [Salvia hispanica]|uniref:protein NRT1/ PTR FAMILY 5.11-like n=1 Tax=Salvia hispanica TaxID=49212 RepID=UPI0020093CEF|nr:protein NRT1/ PTR FAMILY 5.11-like [Salvia hispanica]
MKRIQELRQIFHNYVVFTKPIFFMLGLIFSYKLVENAFLSILITHLTDAWGKNQYDLLKAAMVVNLQEGTESVSVILFVYLADVHTGRFNMVAFATAFCIAGLLLNFASTRNDDDKEVNLGLFYLGLGLLTFAQAALSVTLRVFLYDQLRPKDADQREDRRKRRTKFWWKLVSFVAAIFSLFGPLNALEFGILAVVLAAVTGVCFLVFLLGSNYYHHEQKIENQFKDVGIVLARAYRNRNAEYPQGSFNIETQIPPCLWGFRWEITRWLDKAAIAHGGGCSDAQVEKVKRLIKMLPMWSCFLTLSLVAASGSTFFFEEASVIEDGGVIDNDNKILFLANVVRFTDLVGSVISNYIMTKLRDKMKFNQQRMELVKIGMGMLCCVSCCIVAWGLASLRRNYYINVFWLTPQFILLGLMQGLSEDGLESFYESQASKSLLSYGPPFGELVMGIGKFMSIPCVLIFSMTSIRWFQKDIDASRLDKYYIFLAVLSFLNFVLYCFFGWWYRNNTFLARDEENGDIVQQSEVITLVEGVEPRSVEGRHISQRSLSSRFVSKGKGSGRSEAGNATADRSGSGEEEMETYEDPLLGSTDQSTSEHISYRSDSEPRESSCGDVTVDGEEAEAETHEDPLLGSSDMSTRNTTMNFYALLRVVTLMTRLSSRAARKRSNPKHE